MGDQKLNILITAQNKAEAALSQVKSQLAGIEKSTTNLRTVFGTMAIAGAAAMVAIGAGIYKTVSAAADAEKGIAALNAVISSTGGVAGVTARAAQDLAQSLSQVSIYEDDTIIKAETMILRFQHIGQDIFPQVTQAALDVATGMGVDLTSAAELVGRALENPVNASRNLRAMNILLSASQEDLVKKLIETGKGAEAQQVILDALAKTYGGSALSQAKTLSGALKILGNNFNELQEQIGNALVQGFKPLLTSLNDTLLKAIKWVEQNPQLVRAIVAATVAAAALTATIGLLGIAFVTLNGFAIALGVTAFSLLGPLGLIVGVIGAITAGVGIATYHFANFKGAQDNVAGTTAELTAKTADLGNGIEAVGSKIADTAKKIQGLRKDLQGIIDDAFKQEADSNKNIAELFVQQEQKVADLKTQIEEKKAEVTKASADKQEDSVIQGLLKQQYALQDQETKEQNALVNHQVIIQGLDTQHKEALRRAAETDFERRLEDLQKTQIENRKATAIKIKDKQAEIDALIAEENRYTVDYQAKSNTRITATQQEINKRLELNSIGTSGNGIVSGFNSFVGGIGNFLNNAFSGRASGGPVTAGVPYTVGERGPETFIPRTSGTIIPNGGGGNINVYNPVLLDDSMINRFSQQIAFLLRKDFRV